MKKEEILKKMLEKKRFRDDLTIEEIIKIEPVTSPEIRGWFNEIINLTIKAEQEILEEIKNNLVDNAGYYKNNKERIDYVLGIIDEKLKEIKNDKI